ncbi:MAG: hypothetical protein NW200_12455 [Hyphomonadaceae bacterium]|nr:hypothetical protein [Hyphomonadaceae bacterium]
MTDDLKPWAHRPKHLQRFTDPRTGREHVYFRRGKGPKVRLDAPWGTQALADEAATAAARLKARPAPQAGTLTALVAAYRDSADFLALAPKTQKDYGPWLARFDVTFADLLIEDVDAGYILDLRDAWARRGHRAANIALQVLKNVLKPAMARRQLPGDLFAGIGKVKRPKALGEGNPRWLDEEVEAVIAWAIGRDRPGLARAVALGRWGGFRKQTICALPERARVWRQGAKGAERRIYWLTEKRIVRCDRREDPRLTALLERTAATGKVAPLTVAFNSHGTAWTPRALSHALEDALTALAKSGTVRATLTMHGLRHARGVELALAGASDAEIMSQLDQASAAAAKEYRRQADRIRMADNAQDRVDAEVLRIADAAKNRGQSETG